MGTNLASTKDCLKLVLRTCLKYCKNSQYFSNQLIPKQTNWQTISNDFPSQKKDKSIWNALKYIHRHQIKTDGKNRHMHGKS